MARGTKPSDINAAVRSKQALELRKQGATLEEIAHSCGYQDKSGAWRAIKRELDRLPAPAVDEWRKVQLSRLEQMHSECWLLAMDRKNKGRLFAMDRLLMVNQAINKLLGLDIAKDGNIALAQTIIREVPPGYLSPPPELTTEAQPS